MNRRERRAAEKRSRGAPAYGTAVAHTADLQRIFALAARHRQNGELAEAEAICRNILQNSPRHAPSHYLLGTIAMQVGRPDMAEQCFGKAISFDNRTAAYHNDLGLALQAQGRIDEAIESFRRAIKLEPRNGRAYNNLAVAFESQGQLGEASAQFAKALERTPELFNRYPDVCATLYRLNPAVEAAVARANEAWPRRLSLDELLGPDGYARLAGERLLQAMLVCCEIRAMGLERLLTSVRHALLKSAAEGNSAVAQPDDLEFRCALARQCFVNEYVFAMTPEEADTAERLKRTLAAALAARAPAVPHTIAMVASYFALGAIADAGALLDRRAYAGWPPAFDALLTMQLREPLEEQRLRATIAALTPIEDETSILVRRQYEENPYPRWILPPSPSAPMSIEDVLRTFQVPSMRGVGTTDGLDILVAGCGTGHQPISIAQQYRGARVLAIDLSLASLAYAARKSRELGIDNITYAQADILKLGSLGRTFDMVDSSGVLHHMADPVAAWRILLSLVRPDGFMRLGLYSELARRDIVAMRNYCAEQGYEPTADGIRAARQQLMQTQFGGAVSYNDFFSVSECRDLLFHVQERRFTLARIRAFIAEHDLDFIGFEVPPEVAAAYVRQFPDDPARRNLAHWEEFETKNPGTFLSMYQFWVQKR